MCRWAAYRGPQIFMEEVIASPCQSLIVQSQHAREGKAETNGDGFGIAWYSHRPDPGVYRDILPAWSDPNLRNLARQVRSHLFLAHVRASTGTATNRANCHPFAVGRWCFMHNGQIAGYDRLRRQLDALLPDELYRHRLGTTDSEVMFLLALALGLDSEPAAASTAWSPKCPRPSSRATSLTSPFAAAKSATCTTSAIACCLWRLTVSARSIGFCPTEFRTRAAC